jgi:membrane protein DedA with SNARE-associated domain
MPFDLLTAVLSAVSMSGAWWAFAAIFVAVAASWAGIPCIGATAAGAAGVAASQGRLDLSATVVLIIVAAEVGGLVGYHIGSRWGRELAQRAGKHQAYRQQVLDKGERLYERWGRLAVFFTPAIVSGTANMPRRQFIVWNLLDAIGFTFLTVGAAYGVGRLVAGHHGLVDVAIFVVGVGVGTLLLLIVRHHHKVLASS